MNITSREIKLYCIISYTFPVFFPTLTTTRAQRERERCNSISSLSFMRYIWYGHRSLRTYVPRCTVRKRFLFLNLFRSVC